MTANRNKADSIIRKQIEEDPNQAIFILMKQMAKFLVEADNLVDMMNRVNDEITSEQESVKRIIKMLIEHSDAQRKELFKHGIEFDSPIPEDVMKFLEQIEIANAGKESRGKAKH